MENNFSIKIRQHHNDLYINLHGIFDGASAFELVKTLKGKNNKDMSMFIDTTHLTTAIPFGKAILDTHLPKNKFRNKVHFSGSYARSIIPEGCILLKGRKTKQHTCSGICKNCRCRSKQSVSHNTIHEAS